MSMIRIFMVTTIAVSMLAWPAMAVANPPVHPGLPGEALADPLGAILALIDLVVAYGWTQTAGALALAIVVALLLRVAGRWDLWRTDRGRAVFVAVVALLSALGAGLASGAIGAGLLIAGLTWAWAAVGARQWIRRVLWPEDGTHWLPWLRDLLGEPGRAKTD